MTKRTTHKKQIKVFVSGCYAFLHPGHLQFFIDAKALGDFLIVCFCSEKNYRIYKHRETPQPDANQMIILSSYTTLIDKVVKGSEDGGIWDFVPQLEIEKPDILVVTEDDKYKEEKRRFCDEQGIKFVVLPKNPFPGSVQISTSQIIERIKKKID